MRSGTKMVSEKSYRFNIWIVKMNVASIFLDYNWEFYEQY